MIKKLCITSTFALLISCTNSVNLPIVQDPSTELITIKSRYSSELASLMVGEYIASVNKKFPGMLIASDTMKNTIYEFTYDQPYRLHINKHNTQSNTDETTKVYSQKLSFYFINKKLVHWQ